MKGFFIFFIITSLNAADTKTVVKPKTFTDKDGDVILVLDTEARLKLRSGKEIKATNIYDTEAAPSKPVAPKILKYKIYQVLPGENLKTISEKLYGTQDRWKEIQIFNKSDPDGLDIKPGMKLKYIIDEKDLSNDGQHQKNTN
ncbi:MAG: hypothetical protein Q7U04_02640 [Bacteriovorax sp.]|nr:hypothetical protein [Bacteriovorax sp.]